MNACVSAWRVLPTVLLAACSGSGPATIDTQGETDTDVGVAVEVVEVGSPTCAQPALRGTAGPFSRHTMADTTPAREAYVYGGGIVAQDFDSDGQHELVTLRDRTAEYLDWDGSTWVAHPERLPDLTADDMDFGFGGAAMDVDADGDLDLLVTRWGAPNHAWLNDGTGRFTTAPSGHPLEGPPTHHSMAPSFADLDGDGDLDLLVAGHGFIDEEGADPEFFEPGDDTLVYINRLNEDDGESGGWELDSARLPDAAHDGYSFLGGLVDFDVDGDPDVLLVNDFGRRYRSGMLLWNDGSGHFTADDNAVGLDLPVAGMGLAVGELNGDGRPDVLVPFWGGYAYMQSSGNLWADFTAVSNLTPALGENQTVGWGALFGDLDNDTLDDAVVMHGYIETNISENTPTQPDALFRQTPEQWDNVTRDWDQLDTGDGRGLVVADLDGDGWLDYARPDLTGATRIYMGRCGTASWLSVALEQPGDNPRAVGAVLEARVAGREAPITRYVLSGGIGLGSDIPAEQHFGLSDATSVDLSITWPDGERTEVLGVSANQRVRISRL